MNQKHLQHVSHASLDVNLMVGNVTRNDQCNCEFKIPINITCEKNLIPRILVHKFVIVKKIVRLVNN